MKVNESLSILLWLNKGKASQDGKVPIWVRLTVNGKRSSFSLGKKEERKTIIQAIDFVIEKFTQKVAKEFRAPASLTKWKTTKEKLEAFLKFQFKTNDIPLDKITYTFAEDFIDYLMLEDDIGGQTCRVDHLHRQGLTPL